MTLCVSMMVSAQTKNDNWTFTRDLKEGTRGGNSVGAPLSYDTKASESWKLLKNTKWFNKYEEDRAAILALQGTYQAKFEFLETIMMNTNKKDIPYASWGTEIVKVIEDRGDFISLQHIMVMFTKNQETGKVEGPYVLKHWRQDWQYEGIRLLEFRGSKKWELRSLDPEITKGQWVWSVYQVDDSPRYSGYGKWDHFKSSSLFETNFMARPLPRREFSVRSDYKVLMGKDTLVLTRNSWYHEQRNFKHVENIGSDNKFTGTLLSREIGHNSYKRLTGFDKSEGEAYWAKTSTYWESVRKIWKEIALEKGTFSMISKVNGKPLYSHHFSQAVDPKVQVMNIEKRENLIRSTINSFIK